MVLRVVMVDTGLQWVQFVLTAVVSGVISGQNTDTSALKVMEVTP